MAKRLQAPVAVALDDANAERVRRSHDQRIRELQSLPAASLAVIPDVELADGVETPVPHGLGRAVRWHKESSIRGPSTAGVIEEVRGGTWDRTRYVVLKASGYGATITIDLAVM